VNGNDDIGGRSCDRDGQNRPRDEATTATTTYDAASNTIYTHGVYSKQRTEISACTTTPTGTQFSCEQAGPSLFTRR
jgi:hypothetical protein